MIELKPFLLGYDSFRHSDESHKTHSFRTSCDTRHELSLCHVTPGITIILFVRLAIGNFGASLCHLEKVIYYRHGCVRGWTAEYRHGIRLRLHLLSGSVGIGVSREIIHDVSDGNIIIIIVVVHLCEWADPLSGS